MGKTTVKVYQGHRIGSGGPGEVEVTVRTNDRPRPLRHVVLHSPTGMEWGYAGSGPADLALSILTDFLGSRIKAERLHQWFKSRFIAGLPRNEDWEITGDQITGWLEEIVERVCVIMGEMQGGGL